MPTVNIEVSNERREDMLIGALEGGSNYWYWLGEEATKIIDKYTKPPSQHMIPAMWKAIEAGETIPIHDKEDIEGEKIGEINLASIAKGEQLMANKYLQHFTDMVNENDDAITADVWFQLSSLGELIYG